MKPRRAIPDLRPLDPLQSLKTKLGVLVAATATLAVLITWLGLQASLGPSRTFPLAIVLSLLLTQILARGMTSPLREMTAAVQAMADGDYTTRVHATSQDEVGQLATAFNMMAEDLESVEQTRRDLIANVSHELRTPVAALQALLENMVDGVAEPTPAALEQALAQTERLTRLVTYLLDLSASHAQALAASLVDPSVDIRRLVADILGFSRNADLIIQLGAAAQEPDPDVAAAAQQAIARLQL